MTDDLDEVAATIRRRMAQLAGTRTGARLSDDQLRHRQAFEGLAQHPDPVLQEIGEQLRDGTMTPSDVLRVPAYAEAFRTAAQRAELLDPRQIAAELGELVERESREGQN
jgi:hypothetical protein